LSPQKTPAPKAASETQLIARAQRGEEEAFAALFEAHKRRVYSLCLRMTGNTAEAEDLAQEAFLQLFRKISTFRGESAFSTWLHRLAVNVVLMHLRKRGLQQVSLDEVDNSQDEPVKRDYGDNDRRLIGSVDRIGLQRAIAELPPGYRTVFVLHDVEGYEHNEIAEIMNCSVGNSKSQLHKARMKLRERLRLDRHPRRETQPLPADEQVKEV
jgi:RNA polymerase sigma-70 factor (ECF subfamily)